METKENHRTVSHRAKLHGTRQRFLETAVQVNRERREPDGKGVVQVNGFLGTCVTFEVAEPFVGMEECGKTVEILKRIIDFIWRAAMVL